MRRSRKPITIASRRSKLAQVQAELVGSALAQLHPGIQIAFRWFESPRVERTGDQGRKGLFTRSVEEALLRKEADLAVHSLKDLPSNNTAGLVLAAVPRREQVHDCLITPHNTSTITDLPHGAVVGTSSLRRAAQLLRLRPDLRIETLHGNVETRLNCVLSPEAINNLGLARDHMRFDATLLAAAGLNRLGLTKEAERPVDTDLILPAACQAALAIQCRADDHVTLTRCLPLNDASTATAVHAERELVSALAADCDAPIAALVEPVAIDPASAKTNADAHWVRLRVRVLSADGQTCLEADEQAKTKDLRRLIKRLVKDLTKQGAAQILSASRNRVPGQSKVPMDASIAR